MAVTSYTSLPNAAVQAGGRPRGSTITALRDNPLAIAECDPTAPVNQAVWHPYNKVTVGDTNDGKIYDFAINGVVASIETPVFEAGYDYRARWASISHNNGTATDFRIELRRQSSGIYNPAGTLFSAAANTIFLSGLITMEGVGQTNMNSLLFPFSCAAVTGVNATAVGNVQGLRTELSAVQRLDRGRFSWLAGSIDNGTMYLDRKRALA